MTTKLSQETIDILQEQIPDREYLISWDESGDIIKIVLMGAARALTAKQKAKTALGTPEERESLIEDIVNSTRNGSMVISFQKSLIDNHLFMSNTLGQGFIMYNRKAVKVCNTLHDIVDELLVRKDDDITFNYVVRYKRKQSKWFLHVGSKTDNLPADYKPGKEAEFKAYDLEKRSHLWDETASIAKA